MIRKVNKQDIEFHQLKRFLANPNIGFSATNVERANDPPDFKITVEDKIVSVEVTRVIDSELKEKEEFRNRIINRAATLFQEKYDDELYCLITFLNVQLDGGQPMLQKYCDELFREIERIFIQHRGSEFNLTVKRHQMSSGFIDRISMRNTMGFSHWQHFSAHKVDWIDLGKLQTIISRKEQDIKNYAGTFDENWLLIVSNIGTKSSTNRFDFLDFSSIEATFNKVFVYKEMEDEIYVIK